MYTHVVVSNAVAECIGFDWDDGNIGKNWPTHRVTDWECEEIFLNEPLVVRSDTGHSRTEVRYYALGQTNRGRRLYIAFAIRNRLIRPISARDMDVAERKFYESTKEDTDVQ
jgi:uncharacterized DUF497 family protein